MGRRKREPMSEGKKKKRTNERGEEEYHRRADRGV